MRVPRVRALGGVIFALVLFCSIFAGCAQSINSGAPIDEAAVCDTTEVQNSSGTRLAAPNLTINTTTRLLTWNAVPNAVRYEVLIGNSPPNQPHNVGTATSYNLTSNYTNWIFSAAPNTYNFRVRAIGNGTTRLTSDWSVARPFTVTAATVAVTGVTMSPTSASVTVGNTR